MAYSKSVAVKTIHYFDFESPKAVCHCIEMFKNNANLSPY